MKSNILLPLLVFVYLLAPSVLFAAIEPKPFKPLVGIPGIDPNASINDYINMLYALSISIAALLAVIKIIIAGVKYMLTDIVTSKEEAKSDIKGALIGLLIVVSAVVVLNQINPQLTQSTLFLSPADRTGSSGPASNTTTAPAPLNQGESLLNGSPDAGSTQPAA